MVLAIRFRQQRRLEIDELEFLEKSLDRLDTSKNLVIAAMI